jgi:hypothetical protein
MQKHDQKVEGDHEIEGIGSKWGLRMLLLLKQSLNPLMNWIAQRNLASQIGNIKSDDINQAKQNEYLVGLDMVGLRN